MKKIILILLTLCAFCNAQTLPVTIINVTPEVTCPLDSVTVCFIIDSQINPNQQYTLTILLNETQYCLFTGFVGELFNPDTLITGEPMYCKKIQLPSFMTPGQWFFKGNTFPQYTYAIWVENCNLTGIKEQSPNYEKPIYRQVYGPILIDQYGRKIIKISE